MSAQVKPKIRLYVPGDYAEGNRLALTEGQSHYLLHVMRCQAGEPVAVFGSEDGEWLSRLEPLSRKTAALALEKRIASHKPAPDIWLAFAPVKNRMQSIVEKATELGVSCLLPVITQRCIVRKIQEEKLQAYAIEAAEQSERHDIPKLLPEKALPDMLGEWDKERILLFADEHGGGEPVSTVLSALPKGKYALLTGPEGGFSPQEQELLHAQPFVRAFGMGPRILRADTAVAAALACIQSQLGDWHEKPRFEAGETA